MRTRIIVLVTAMSMSGILFAEPPQFRVMKEKRSKNQTAGEMKGPDAEFIIRPTKEEATIPELVIPTYSTGRRRVVDVRSSKGRMEVAIQLDELGVDYYDYRLNDGQWNLHEQRRVCSLNGLLALSLAQVDILENGLVEVTFIDGPSGGRASSWDDELLSKQNRGKTGLLKEQYILRNEQFTLSGDPVRLRPSDASNAQKSKEQNKAQHPTDGAPLPEKPKE